MTNAEAVNWLINITADIGKAEHSDLWHYEQALSEIREMLENAQPTVEPQPQWIPVTERLPDKDGRYLVTNSHWGAYEVDWNIFFNNQGWLWEKGVIAWMPLPEPYAERREDA